MDRIFDGSLFFKRFFKCLLFLTHRGDPRALGQAGILLGSAHGRVNLSCVGEDTLFFRAGRAIRSLSFLHPPKKDNGAEAKKRRIEQSNLFIYSPRPSSWLKVFMTEGLLYIRKLFHA